MHPNFMHARLGRSVVSGDIDSLPSARAMTSTLQHGQARVFGESRVGERQLTQQKSGATRRFDPTSVRAGFAETGAQETVTGSGSHSRENSNCALITAKRPLHVETAATCMREQLVWSTRRLQS